MSTFERIVLHIGKHKTGSSSIQASLHGVDHGGFRYAPLRQSNHAKTMMVFSGRLEGKSNARKQDFPSEVLDERREQRLRLLQDALREPRRTQLFSAEVLEGFNHDEVAEIVRFFRGYTDRIEVIGFVRPPISSQLSSFQERVKLGYWRPRLPRVSYRASFEPYLDVLGRDAVHILPFRTSDFVNESLVATLLHALGEAGVPYTEKRRNEGMSADAVKMLFALNRRHVDVAPNKQNYRARLRLWKTLAEKVRGASLKLPDSCHVLRNTADEVEWLKSISGIDFSSDLQRMNPRANDASAALEHAMAGIGSQGLADLAELAYKFTGREPSTAIDAMESLYDAFLRRKAHEG